MLDAQSTGSTAVHPTDSAPHPLRDDFAATDSSAAAQTYPELFEDPRREDLPPNSWPHTHPDSQVASSTAPDLRTEPQLELAALAQRVETARGKLPLQSDPALFAELSDREMSAERDLAEWIRRQRRRQRKRTVAAELTSEKRDRRVALALRRADDADARWHRRARAARMRVSNSDARLAQLFRRAEWSSRALIGVVILGMVWSGVNVQHNLVPSGDMSDPLYWLSYGFEAMISIPIITIMVVATTAARWGRDVDRGKVIFLEAALLGVTIALNAGPHLVAGAPAKAAEAAVAPVMVGVVIWLHAWVSARYAQLIDDIPLDHPDDRSPTGYHREEPDPRSSRLQRMLAPRELPHHDEHAQQPWVSTSERGAAAPSPADPAVGVPPASTATQPITPPRTEQHMFATARAPEPQSGTAAASQTYSSTATEADGPRQHAAATASTGPDPNRASSTGPRATSASTGTPPPARPESATGQQARTAGSPGATQREVRAAAPTAGEATQPTASAGSTAETIAATSEEKPVEPSWPVPTEAAEASARPLDAASPANHPAPTEPGAGDLAPVGRAAVGPAAVGPTDSQLAGASTRTEVTMPAEPTAETEPRPQPDQPTSRGAALRIVSDEPRRARTPKATEDAVQLVLGEAVAELPRRRTIRTGRTADAGTPSDDAGWDIAHHSIRSPVSYALGDEGARHAPAMDAFAGAQSPVSLEREYPDRARRGASVREAAADATEDLSDELDEDFGADSDDAQVGTGTIAAAEIDPVRDESGDVAIWSVAREIHRRGPAKIAVDQLVEVLTLTEESRSPAEIARLVGLSVTRIQRILELARSIAMPVAVGG